MTVDITIPALGESITEATILRWLKTAGEAVERDEVIVEIETDKATMELVAPESGVLSEILKGEGEKVEIGETIGRVTAGGAAQAGRMSERSTKAARCSNARAEQSYPCASHYLPAARCDLKRMRRRRPDSSAGDQTAAAQASCSTMAAAFAAHCANRWLSGSSLIAGPGRHRSGVRHRHRYRQGWRCGRQPGSACQAQNFWQPF